MWPSMPSTSHLGKFLPWLGSGAALRGRPEGQGVQSQEWGVKPQGMSTNISNIEDLPDILRCPIRGEGKSCPTWPSAGESRGHGPGGQWQVQALLLVCGVTLGKLLSFSGPHYSL